MNIFEVLEKRELNATDEFHRLMVILNTPFWDNSTFPQKTCMREIVNEHFHRCSIRSSFLSLDDCLKSLGIDIESKFKIEWKILLLYCEVIFNVIHQLWKLLPTYDSAQKPIKQTIENISVILEKTNRKWEKVESGFIIVDKNPATIEAIECLDSDNESLALEMIEYNRVLLKGNLNRKKEILTNLASYTEPMKSDLKGSEYFTLYNDSRNWVNNLNIRHNNSGKDSVPEYAKSWTFKEYEEWYDKIYHTLLMVIMANKQLEIKQEMNKLQANV